MLAHRLIGFTAPEHLNRWPLRAGGKGKSEPLKIEPAITASSGETLRQLVLSGWGIACLADSGDRTADARDERLVLILGNVLVDKRQPVSAVYYQSASLAGRGQRCVSSDFMAAGE